MKITRTIPETRDAIWAAGVEGKTIGFVPTMGALHGGHLALIRRARAECGYVVLSIFVNPTQFGPSEDFKQYPRDLDRDASLCERERVDLLFNPDVEVIYPPGFDSWVEVGSLTQRFEGASRPGHFRGVTTVCAKLFNITRPDYAYFGMKDYQQLKVIQKMVRDLDMPLDIVPVETVREPDGLAMSSRNAYLSPAERQSATVLSRALKSAQQLFEEGQRKARSVEELVRNLIKAEPLVAMEYAAVADAETLEPVAEIRRDAVILVAARVGKTRLIDNVVLRVPEVNQP